MRELTDRELDAVCGGAVRTSAQLQHTSSKPTDTVPATVGASSAASVWQTCMSVEQSNIGINANDLLVVGYRTLLRSGGGVCIS